MIKLGRLPRPSSGGGIRDPLRLDWPDPGTKDPFLSAAGDFSLITSIFGASGALISGTLDCK